MTTIMRFEWKKLFGRRLNVIAMLAGYILIGVCVFAYISSASFYDAASDGYVHGMKAVRLAQERGDGQTEVISEAYMTGFLYELQSRHMDLESDEAYTEIIRHLGNIFYFTVKNYTDMRDNIGDRNVLMRLNLADGARFYEWRMNKITTYLNLDFSYGNYTEAEKAYWLRKAGNVRTPFPWGGYDIMQIVWETVAIGFFLSFVIVICASTVFSSEYESGAAALLLTARHGTGRMIWAKIAVVSLFTVGYLGVGLGSAVGVIGLLLGFDGAELPVQLWNTAIPYNMTLGQLCVGELALIVLIFVTVALVLLCCSAALRSSLATLAIGMALMIAPAFFPMSTENGLWNHINVLFPVRAMNLKDVLGAYVSYAAGPLVISYVEMIVLAYTAIAAGAGLLIRKGFARRV